VLGIEAVASQPTLSRFFGAFTQQSCSALSRWHSTALFALPSRQEGYTMDLDSWALLHEDGHQEGVATGYIKRGIKPCQRPLIAALAESQMVANYWLRNGNTQCVNGAGQFLRVTLAQMPQHVRVSLLRADSGFSDESFLQACEELAMKYIVVARLTQKVQSLYRHEDTCWRDTGIDGVQVQEVETGRVGRRLILIRQRIAARPEAGGKLLVEVPGYRFQALWSNLSPTVDAVSVWRRYPGRADIRKPYS
jgi:Transposase DDE domain group 1